MMLLDVADDKRVENDVFINSHTNNLINNNDSAYNGPPHIDSFCWSH